MGSVFGGCMTCEVLLEFHGKNPELTKTLFREDAGDVRTAIRGKTSGGRISVGTFQWSSAVRGLALLLSRAALADHRGEGTSTAILQGTAGSLAASLDYAISKEPSWIGDMFGIDISGHSRIRRIIKRSNPARRFPGPVVLVVNAAYLPPGGITIWWDGSRVTDSREIKTLVTLLELQPGAGHPDQIEPHSPEAFFKTWVRAA